MPVRALIIDDSETTRYVVRKTLELAVSELSEIREAMDGQEALEIIALEPEIDLILADVHMPAVDGFELLEELRRVDHPAHVVFITSRVVDDRAAEAQRLGVTAYLTKPFIPEELREVLCQIYGGCRTGDCSCEEGDDGHGGVFRG